MTIHTDCGHVTSAAVECEHRLVCLDCSNDPGCAKCRRIARDEIGATW